MKKIRIVSAVISTVIALGIVSGCAGSTGSSSSPANTAQSTAASSASASDKVLRVGMECSYAPHNWTQTDNSNDSIQIKNSQNEYANGYDVMMAKQLADAIGYKLEIYKIEWDGLIVGVQTGKIDAIIAGMAATDARKKSIDFTNPYDTGSYCIMVKKGSKYENAASINDFSGAKVSSQINTVLYDTLVPQLKGAKVLEGLSDAPTVFAALSSGKLDAAPMDYPTAISAVKTNPDLKVIKFEDGKGYVLNGLDGCSYIGVKKGNSELVGKLNDALKKYSKDDMEKLMQKAVDIQPINKKSAG